jgi:membrane fusion protein (multidrug efflux system)
MPHTRTSGLTFSTLALLSSGLALYACSARSPSSAAPSAVPVGVIVVQPQRVALPVQLPGRTVAFRIAQVRPQVSGIIKRRLFTEGAFVKAGEALYQLDASSYQAAHDSAQAALAKADANAMTVRLRYERYQKLAAAGAVSQQDRDDVTAMLRQAEADQATARAALEMARINLAYTRISAPISGRIATSAYTEGALVTANQDAALTSVQQYDPMYVDLSQSAADALRLRAQFAAGKLQRADERSASVRLQLDDGSTYAGAGRLEFTGITVSESTGAITLRAIFPNPDGRLLPGMYVRALFAQGVDEQALLVPQQAVSRDTRGEAVVMVVGVDSKVEQRSVQIASAIGSQWRISDGLKPGERIIVQGLQNVRAGAQVTPSIVDLAAAH